MKSCLPDLVWFPICCSDQREQEQYKDRQSCSLLFPALKDNHDFVAAEHKQIRNTTGRERAETFSIDVHSLGTRERERILTINEMSLTD